MQKSQSTPLTQLSKCYQNITELPLNRFIDCVVDGNLSALVISGQPTEIEIITVWEEIKMQYADAMKDGESRSFIILQREAGALDISYQKVLLAISTLENYYTKYFSDHLNKLLGTKLKFDPPFSEGYYKDLKTAHDRSKGIMLDLKLKEAAMQAVELKAKGTGIKPTREYFEEIVVAFENRWTQQFSMDMSTWKFCYRVHLLQKEYEQLKRKGNVRRTNK